MCSDGDSEQLIGLSKPSNRSSARDLIHQPCVRIRISTVDDLIQKLLVERAVLHLNGVRTGEKELCREHFSVGLRERSFEEFAASLGMPADGFAHDRVGVSEER